MGIRSTLAKFLAPELVDRGAVEQLVAEEVKRARMGLPFYADYDPKGEGFRRYAIGGNQVRMDILPASHDMMIEIAYFLYATSGMAKKFIEDTKNFVMGRWVTFEVKNDRPDKGATDLLKEFWKDSINRMDVLLGPRVAFLGLLGEQCWPVTVNPHNGFVQVSYVDPANIDDVIPLPGFAEIADIVQVRSVERGGQPLRVIRKERDPRKPEYGRLAGDCFYWAINKPPNSPRGWSDLLQAADFISSLEESLFSELDRLNLMKAFIWDVTYEGADENDIKKFRERNPPPKPGSLRIHNEKVTWKAEAPDLQHQDTKYFFDMMRSYVSGVQGRPDSWFGSGGKAYQTEADLMGEPTYRDLEVRQNVVRTMLEEVLRFVADQAILHRALPEPEGGGDYEICVNLPSMRKRDLKTATDSLNSVTQSLVAAETQGWARKETCQRIWAAVASETGVEVDAEEEIEEARKRDAEQVSEDYRKVRSKALGVKRDESEGGKPLTPHP